MNWATFDALGQVAESRRGEGEGWSLWLVAEDSDFVRFNHGRVRQAGTVHDATVDVRWHRGRRHAGASVQLTRDASEDRARLLAAIDELRARLEHLPEDPHLLLPVDVVSTDDDDRGASPDAGRATADIVDAARSSGLDLVGFYAGGAIHRGFLDSRGQRNTFTTHGYSFDWSLVHDGARAVKQSLAGAAWDPAALGAELAAGRVDLAALARPARKLEPGVWRAYLAPGALHEIFDTMGWNGFSAREQRRRQSCLQKLVAGERSLDPRISVREGRGLAPRFTSDGFLRPEVVPLIEGGRHAGALVGARSAAETGVACNGAEESETPVSLEVAGGELPAAEARRALGTGVWVSQLWYANFSDLAGGRLTGLTRFATLWVQDGEPVGPVEAMRFDDSVYDLLGGRLEALTSEPVLMPSTSTYGGRSTQSMRLPGALVSGLSLTL